MSGRVYAVKSEQHYINRARAVEVGTGELRRVGKGPDGASQLSPDRLVGSGFELPFGGFTQPSAERVDGVERHITAVVEIILAAVYISVMRDLFAEEIGSILRDVGEIRHGVTEPGAAPDRHCFHQRALVFGKRIHNQRAGAQRVHLIFDVFIIVGELGRLGREIIESIAVYRNSAAKAEIDIHAVE